MHARSIAWPRPALGLAAALLTAAAAAPALAAGLDPADQPILRHVLPAEALDLVMAKGEVHVLAWSELEAILAKGRKARADGGDEPAKDEAPFRLDGLDLDLVLEPGARHARLVLKTRLTVTAEGWRSIPLLGGEVTPGALKVSSPGSGKAAQGWLVPAGGGWGVLVDGPGARALELEAFLPVERQGYLELLEARVPPVPGARARVVLPGKDLEVFMDPAPEAHLEATTDSSSIFRASIPPGSPLSVRWFPRDAGLQGGDGDQAQVEAAGLEALETRGFATWAHTLVFGHGRLEARVALSLQVYRRPLDEVRIVVGEGIENLEIEEVPGLVERVEDLPDGKRILLRSRRAGTLNLPMRYSIEKGSASFKVAIPRLRVQGAMGERELYWVGRATNVRLSTPSSAQFEPLAEGGFADFPAHPEVHDPLLRFQRVDQDATLEFEVERFPDAPGVLTKVIDRAVASTQVEAHGRATTTLQLWVRDRSGRPLPVWLPAGAEPTDFRVGGQRVDPPKQADGAYSLALRDAAREGGDQVRVELRYQHPVATLGFLGSHQVPLARVGAPLTHLEWSVQPPSGYLVHSPTPRAKGRGQGLAWTRRAMPAGQGDHEPVRVSFRYATRSAHSLLRAFALLLGMWAGWLVCRVLVGALPLVSSLGLLVPLGFLGVAPLSGVSPSCAYGFLSALAAGTLVGLMRLVQVTRMRLELRRLKRQRTAASMKALRQQLDPALAKVRPDRDPEAAGDEDGAEAAETAKAGEAPNADQAPKADQAPEAEQAPEADQAPEPDAASKSDQAPEATGADGAEEAPPPTPPDDPPKDPPKKKDGGTRRRRSKAKGRKGGRS